MISNSCIEYTSLNVRIELTNYQLQYNHSIHKGTLMVIPGMPLAYLLLVNF
jgi:hypothetical protein